MKVIPLHEGFFTIDHSKQFIPFDPGSDNLQDRNTGSLLVSIQPFLVISSEDVILIDTGLGFEQNGKLQLHQNMIAHGINPSEVTKVLMSHLHKDHAGAVGNRLHGSLTELAFPQATYYVQQKEFEFAMTKGKPSYLTDELECLRNAPNVVWLQGDGVIDGYIKHEITGAHCPFHQVFRIVDGGQTVFFGGDDAPQYKQMKSRFVAKYDYDGKKCMELRQAWWEKGQEEGWEFLYYHDAPVG